MTEAALIARLLLGAVFLMSSLTKLAAPHQFRNDVHNYGILPRALEATYARALPYAEFGTGLLLLSGYYQPWAAALAVGMLVSFMIAVGIVMARGQNLTCSCFGLLYREKVGASTQVRDGVLLIAALYIGLQGGTAPTVVDLVANVGRLDHALGLGLTLAALAASLIVAVYSVRLTRAHVGHGDVA